MAEEVQALIDKIKSEGIQAADQKSREIEEQAKAQAQQIVERAKKEAEQLILDAKEEIKKMQESTHMALKQSSRDTLLSLRKEIENILQKIVTAQISDTLTPDHLSNIICDVIKHAIDAKVVEKDVTVAVNAKDLEKLKKGALAKLQKQLKEPIKLESSNDIAKGFSISFDGGKSSFDFTDESLADYLSTFLNDQVSALVKESV